MISFRMKEVPKISFFRVCVCQKWFQPQSNWNVNDKISKKANIFHSEFSINYVDFVWLLCVDLKSINLCNLLNALYVCFVYPSVVFKFLYRYSLLHLHLLIRKYWNGWDEQNVRQLGYKINKEIWCILKTIIMKGKKRTEEGVTDYGSSKHNKIAPSIEKKTCFLVIYSQMWFEWELRFFFLSTANLVFLSSSFNFYTKLNQSYIITLYFFHT